MSISPVSVMPKTTWSNSATIVPGENLPSLPPLDALLQVENFIAASSKRSSPDASFALMSSAVSSLPTNMCEARAFVCSYCAADWL